MDARVADEWRVGWSVAMAGAIGLLLMTLHIGSLGVLIKPLGATFSWSRAEISFGVMIVTIIQCAVVPFVGRLMYMVALRRIAFAGGLLYALGLIAIASSSADIRSWYAGWAILGLGITGISPVLWTAAIMRMFDRSRGLAFSVALSGTGISSLILPLGCAWIYEYHGWRVTFLVLAAFVLFVLLPAIVWLTRHPAFDSAPRPLETGDSRRFSTVLVSPGIVCILLASILMAAAVGSVSTHFQAMLQDVGVPPMAAAAYFAVSGPALILGRLASGVLLDRLPTAAIACFLCALPAVTCALLIGYEGSRTMGLVIGALFGLGYGAESDLFAYLCSRYFDRRHYPLLYSLVYGVFSLSYGASGVIAGAAYDRVGHYRPVLIALIIGVAIAIGLILLLTRRSSAEHPASGVPS